MSLDLTKLAGRFEHLDFRRHKHDRNLFALEWVYPNGRKFVMEICNLRLDDSTNQVYFDILEDPASLINRWLKFLKEMGICPISDLPHLKEIYMLGHCQITSLTIRTSADREVHEGA